MIVFRKLVLFWNSSRQYRMPMAKLKGILTQIFVLRATLELNDYDKAIVVSSDGDFYSLVQHLYEKNKLKSRTESR